MNAKSLVCPVSNERVNERVVRANAFFTIVLMVSGIWFESVPLLLFLAVDFFIRAFMSAPVSPVAYVSRKSVLLLGMGNKPIDKAPKVFAARMGFAMTLLTLLCIATGLNGTALTLATVLVIFASLELIVNFCAGCYIYSYLVLPLFDKSSK